MCRVSNSSKMTAGLADSKAEWRSGIEVFDSKSLSIADLEIAETGGDGILLDGCTGCTVRKVNWKGACLVFVF